MDQKMIGRFISEMRKEKHLTQRELADKLMLSDKTVSKWETGKGLPEVSLMLPLCEILGISVNELLSGQRLTAEDYKNKAEENILKLMNEREMDIKRIIYASICAVLSIVMAVSLIVIAAYNELSLAARITVIVIALIILAAGIGAACVLERDVGYYECKKCGAKFTPSMKAYIMGSHTIRTRRLRCPECGKKSYCRKRLSDKE